MSVEDGLWVQTFSGTAVDLLQPRPEQILLIDVAHALSRIARFNGHTRGPLPWSVAQHSLLVESLLPDGADPATRLLALLHDAHEAYLGDMTTPVHRALLALMPVAVDPVETLKAGLDVAIRGAFALPEPSEAQRAAIVAADLLALRVERDALMAPPPREWVPLPEPPDPLPVLAPVVPDEARTRFIYQMRLLIAMRHGMYFIGEAC